jgi:hypothetical protein
LSITTFQLHTPRVLKFFKCMFYFHTNFSEFKQRQQHKQKDINFA